MGWRLAADRSDGAGWVAIQLLAFVPRSTVQANPNKYVAEKRHPADRPKAFLRLAYIELAPQLAAGAGRVPQEASVAASGHA